MTARQFLFVGLIAAALFVGLAAYGDFRGVTRRLAAFPAHYFMAALVLTGLNFALRFIRWNYYLTHLGQRVSPGLSVTVFLGGLAMSATPAKVGEFAKSYYLQARAGVPATASMPAIFMERVTDLAAVAFLALSGFWLVPGVVRWLLVTVLAAGCIGLAFLLSRHSNVILALPGFRRWRGELLDCREELQRLTRARPLVVALILAGLAWAAEGIGFWVVLLGLGFDPGPWWSTAVYAASTIVGALTTLPGGIGGTEGTLTVLTEQAGAERDAAVAATLLIRWATLWFAVATGAASLVFLHLRKHGKLSG